jgi:hypothetical protein
MNSPRADTAVLQSSAMRCSVLRLNLGRIIFPTISPSEGRARDAKDNGRYFPADLFWGR